MLKSLSNTHQFSKIAIVGSGPSAILFSGQCDKSIGVNGSSMLGPRFDYFLCGDYTSPDHDWFFVNCSSVRIVAKIVASLDHQLYPQHLYNDLHREAFLSHHQRRVNIPNPVAPHRIFKYKRYKKARLSIDQNCLLYGGTISCCALQLAWIMGAKSVDLYGCEFTHKSGHYFYESDKPGRIVKTQRDTMQEVINHLRNEGLKISMIGDSTLL